MTFLGKKLWSALPLNRQVAHGGTEVWHMEGQKSGPQKKDYRALSVEAQNPRRKSGIVFATEMISNSRKTIR